MISSDVDIDDYHAAKALSHSKLRDLALRGPRYFAMRHISRTTPPDVDTEAQIFGQLFEDIVQGRGLNRDAYAVKPEGMSFATKDGKAWRSDAVASGKRIVTAGELASMDEMHESLRENETALDMIRACQSQAALECAYPGTPGLQARPDWLSSDGCARTAFTPFSLDLKTTISLAKLVSGRGVLDHGYHSQAAIVRHAMRANGYVDTAHYLLACEKKRPYRCQVIEIPVAWLDIGWAWCERQIARLARHYESGSWPRVDCEMVTLPQPPAWAENDVGDEDAA